VGSSKKSWHCLVTAVIHHRHFAIWLTVVSKCDVEKWWQWSTFYQVDVWVCTVCVVLDCVSVCVCVEAVVIN
jgi:hypothetical protein